MSDLDTLIHRYLDDRAELSTEELDALVAGLRAEPARAIAVREQLLIDDLLAQRLTLDRRNFLAQVDQRLADFERGEDEIDNQVSDLRALAEAEIQHPHAPAGSGWVLYALAISAALLIGAFLIVPRVWTPGGRAVAKVVAVQGSVVARQDKGSSALNVGGALLSGQEIVTPPGGTVTLQYADQTQVRIGGDSLVKLAADSQTGAKRVDIRQGEISASISKQQAGAMLFTTPHAVATVLGTKLRITVGEATTMIDVSEGAVQFDHRAGGKPIVVKKHETGLATAEMLELRQLRWPDEQREAITYLADPFELGMIARNPQSRQFRDTILKPRGEATLNEFDHSLELAGGWFSSEDAGSDILDTTRLAGEFTLELVFTPDSHTQSGPARIVALADGEEGPNFLLAQDGKKLVFSLRTDGDPLPQPMQIEVPPLKQATHLAFTYARGELTAYRDGVEIAVSKKLSGNLTNWRPGPLTVGASASGDFPWHGTVEGFALFNRRLSSAEIARNMQNFRILAGR